MGFIRGLFTISLAAAAGTTSGYIAWTRASKIRDIPLTDPIFQYTKRYNPKNSPVTQDICVREVRLRNIQPGLLEDQVKLTEAFCAGVWSGMGYAYQRRYLEKKYRADLATADNLWDKQELMASKYEVGTKITDHFEVISKTPGSIIVRCGDSPRVQELRASDGLFEMSTEINKDKDVVIFGLKSVFYNGLGAQPDATGKPPSGPMTPWIQWLHQQYDKIWMETAIRNCMK